MNIVNGSEAEIVAWALNYVQTAAKFDLGEVEAKDFATVDWDAEVVAINELLEDFIKFTNSNKISTVNKLVSFIKNKDFLKDEYHETFNLNIAFELNRYRKPEHSTREHFSSIYENVLEGLIENGVLIENIFNEIRKICIIGLYHTWERNLKDLSPCFMPSPAQNWN